MCADQLAQCGLSAAVGREVLAEVHAAQFSDTLTITQAPRALLNLAIRYAIRDVLTVNDIRRKNLVALIDEARTASALGARSGISASLISQWKNGSPDSKTGKPRQISSESCRRIEAAMGKEPGWMDQQRWTPEQHAPEGRAATGMAHDLSDPPFEDELQQHPWEFIVSASTAELSKRFIAAVPDGALAPTTPKGTEYVFAAPGGQPRDSVVVIVQTASGRRAMRLYFALDAGAWEARARDAAYPSFHSERDGLQLLAVATMRPGGEG